MAALPRMRSRVWLNPQDDGDPKEVVADIRHVDRLTAERTLVGMGIQIQDGMVIHMTTAWAWAALKRQGDYDGDFARFMSVDCLAIEDDEEAPPVDPTRSGPLTDSPSNSPSPFPEPPSSSGSPPMTT